MTDHIRWYDENGFGKIKPFSLFNGGIYDIKKFEDLVGYKIIHIELTYDSIIFELYNREKYKLYHEQDCCEKVNIEDITGDLDDLIGEPILKASVDHDDDVPNRFRRDDVDKWTFYNIATIKGHVTIRWHGSSNGYYSIEVSFMKMENDN